MPLAASRRPRIAARVRVLHVHSRGTRAMLGGVGLVAALNHVQVE
jgi:hypothetical protein